jgi:hypothetical protein
MKIFFIILIIFPLQINHSWSQKVRLALWNYHLDKFNVDESVSPLDGFCFKAHKGISYDPKTGEKNVEEDMNSVYLLIVDGSTGKRYLCMGGFDEKVSIYNMSIKPEEEIKIFFTQKNYFSPNICKVNDSDGMPGVMKFSRDQLLIYNEADQLIGEFQGSLLSNDEIEIYTYDSINHPTQKKVY